MKEFGRNKIALFLTCMSILGNRTSAMNTNKVQNPQTVAAVGRVTARNNQSVKQGLTKNQKWAIGAAVSLAVVSAAGFTIWGVKRHNDKKLLEEEKMGKAVSDRFRKFDTLDKQFKSFKAPDKQFESFKASTNKGNQEIDDSSNKDENDKNDKNDIDIDVDDELNKLEEYEKQFKNMQTLLEGTKLLLGEKSNYPNNE